MYSISTARKRRALKFLALGALVAMSAALAPGIATAGMGPSRSVYLKQAVKFDGQSWLLTINGWDSGSSDYVSVALRKAYKKKKDGKLVYNLKESQTWDFSSLNDSTLVIKDDLTGSIDLGNQAPELFDANIVFKAISGKGINKKCDGNIKTRAVKTTSGSSMSLKTGNSLFGNVTKVPAKGTVTTNNGKCPIGHGNSCPHAGKNLYAYGSMDDGSSFSWSGSVPNSGGYASIFLNTSRSLAESAWWYASYSGKVVKSRVQIPNDLSTGEVDGSNLPKLSGKGKLTATGSKYTSDWSKCGKDKRYRPTDRPAEQSGTLTFTPSGSDPVGVDQEFSFEYGNLGKMEVGKR